MHTSLDLSGLRKAIAAFESCLVVYARRGGEKAADDEMEALRAGVIQSFEFTYELCWKHMKRWIEMNVNPESVDGVPRRELFRVCAENKLLTDVDEWMGFHGARNSTSHIYNQNMALEVFGVARKFLPYAKDCLSRLEEHQ